MNSILTTDAATFDVRRIPCRTKHAQIFQRWTDLAVGQFFILVNDHDPVPLYYQFAGQFPGAFDWEYLEEGPTVFQVKITRLLPTNGPALTPPRKSATPPAAAVTEVEIDVRGLEPPEPLMRILQRVETLAAGEILRARTDRKPVHLLPELELRGVRHESVAQADGSWVTTLARS